MLEVIIGLHTIIPVENFEEAISYHAREMYGKGASETFDSVILENGKPLKYISYNGRIWDWDEKDNAYSENSNSMSKELFDAFIKNKKGGITLKDLHNKLKDIMEKHPDIINRKIIISPKDDNKSPYFMIHLPVVLNEEVVITI